MYAEILKLQEERVKKATVYDTLENIKLSNICVFSLSSSNESSFPFLKHGNHAMLFAVCEITSWVLTLDDDDACKK